MTVKFEEPPVFPKDGLTFGQCVVAGMILGVVAAFLHMAALFLT